MSPRDAVKQMQQTPTVDITVAGAALGVRSSRAYELADEGVIPTIRVGKLRRVVPSSRMLEMLGVSAPQEAA